MQEGIRNSKNGLCVSRQKMLKNDQACRIVITCGKPSTDGKMSVEMTYDGDPSLASYLLETAQGFIDRDDDWVYN